MKKEPETLTNRNYIKPEEKYSTCAPKEKKNAQYFHIEWGLLPAEELHGKPLTDLHCRNTEYVMSLFNSTSSVHAINWGLWDLSYYF